MITTVSRKKVDIVNPKADQIDISDIAHSLSMIPRFCGHLDKHYSVALHSCLVYDLAKQLFPDFIQLHKYALFHDAHESFTSDIPTPVKRMVILSSIEYNLDCAIFQKADLSIDVVKYKPIIKFLDNIAIVIEDFYFRDGDFISEFDDLICQQAMCYMYLIEDLVKGIWDDAEIFSKGRDKFLERYAESVKKEFL